MIDGLEKDKKVFIVIAAIITISLAVILLILIRLRKADKNLINKSIEVIRLEQQHQLISNPNESNLSVLSINGESKLNNNDAGKEKMHPNFQLVKLIANLEKLMDEEKLYLNPGISLDEVADKLESNRSYLSKAINQIYNSNFTSYINDLRIKEAIRVITKKDVSLFTIEGIGEQIGFCNRITFVHAFKKYTGVTPSFFMKNMP